MVEPIPDDELEYVILHEGIDVNSFSCSNNPEEADLEEFLKEDALRCQNSFFSVTRVVLWKGVLVGYFTLVTDCIKKEEMTRRDRIKGYKYRFYPAIKIARLAVHDDYRHRNNGINMLIEIFSIVGDIAENVGCRILTVDAKPASVGFYEKSDFQRALVNRGDPQEIPFLFILTSYISSRRGKIQRRLNIPEYASGKGSACPGGTFMPKRGDMIVSPQIPLSIPHPPQPFSPDRAHIYTWPLMSTG